MNEDIPNEKRDCKYDEVFANFHHFLKQYLNQRNVLLILIVRFLLEIFQRVRDFLILFLQLLHRRE